MNQSYSTLEIKFTVPLKSVSLKFDYFIFQIFQGCDVVVLRGPCPRLDDCWTDLLPQEVLRGPPGRLEVPR